MWIDCLIIIVATISLIILVCKHSDSTFNKTIIIISCLIICCCIVTCKVTTPENPRVYVKGYTRKDGTVVSGYTRRKPNRQDKGSPYFTSLSIVSFLTGVFALTIMVKHEEKQNKEKEIERAKQAIKRNEQVFHKQIQEDSSAENANFNALYREENIGLSLLNYNKLIEDDVVCISCCSSLKDFIELHLTGKYLDAICNKWGFIFYADHPKAKFARTLFFSKHDDLTDIDHSLSWHLEEVIRYDYSVKTEKHIDNIRKVVSRIFSNRPYIAIDKKTIQVLTSYGCIIDTSKAVDFKNPVSYNKSYSPFFKNPFLISRYQASDTLQKALFETLVLTEQEKETFNQLSNREQLQFLQHFLHQFDLQKYNYLKLKPLTSKKRKDYSYYAQLKDLIMKQGWKQISRLSYIKQKEGTEKQNFRDAVFSSLITEAETNIEKRKNDSTSTGKIWYCYGYGDIKITDKFVNDYGVTMILFRTGIYHDGKFEESSFAKDEYELPVYELTERKFSHLITN